MIAPSVNPIKPSGEINLTNENPHSTAAQAAILVLPHPTEPSINKEFNYEFFPYLVYSMQFLIIFCICLKSSPKSINLFLNSTSNLFVSTPNYGLTSSKACMKSALLILKSFVLDNFF